jgi:hypothetical protein
VVVEISLSSVLSLFHVFDFGWYAVRSRGNLYCGIDSVFVGRPLAASAHCMAMSRYWYEVRARPRATRVAVCRYRPAISLSPMTAGARKCLILASVCVRVIFAGLHCGRLVA